MPQTHIRAYLRASTKEQDAHRARADLEAFTRERNQSIAATYVENESGASLKRPELFRLIDDCHPGDVLLIEQVDRLSRLNAEDWQRLRSEIASRRIRVVALDLPTSWAMLTGSETGSAADEFTARMFDAINSMLLDMLAAIARKDYEDRRRRQTQGIAKAKSEGKYRGKPEDRERNKAIMRMLAGKQSWSTIIEATGCSRSTLSRLTQRIKASAAAPA